MQLEGIGVIQPDKFGPFQLRLKFGKQAYFVVALCVAFWLCGCAYNPTPVDYAFEKSGATTDEVERDRVACEAQIYVSWRAGLAAANIGLISNPPSPRTLAMSIPDALQVCMEGKGYKATRL